MVRKNGENKMNEISKMIQKDIDLLQGRINELEKQNEIMKEALENIHVAEMMGLLINGQKVATKALEEIK